VGGVEKYGYIDKTGVLVIPPTYAFAEAFTDGLAAVKIGEAESAKYALIDPAGKVVWQDK
jgi:hypothetical protein